MESELIGESFLGFAWSLSLRDTTVASDPTTCKIYTDTISVESVNKLGVERDQST